MGIIDTIDRTTADIWKEKKRLFAQGDKCVVNELGEGRDILSILREFIISVLSTLFINFMQQSKRIKKHLRTINLLTKSFLRS
jgi:hypothetical protein